MNTIELACHNMTITVNADEGGGSASSDLERETCPHCDSPTCFYDCDHSKAEFEGGNNPDETENQIVERAKYNMALNTIESYTLALVVAFEQKGTPVEGNIKLAIEEAIETALDALWDNQQLVGT